MDTQQIITELEAERDRLEQAISALRGSLQGRRLAGGLHRRFDGRRAGGGDAGNPAIAIPIPVNDKAVPVTSLQLIGPPMSEAALLNVGRLIESERPELDRLVRPPKSFH